MVWLILTLSVCLTSAYNRVLCCVCVFADTEDNKCQIVQRD